MSVWASGVWASGVWADGVWFGMGGGVQPPQPQAETFTGAFAFGGRRPRIREGFEIEQAFEALTKNPETRQEAKQIAKPYTTKAPKQAPVVDFEALKQNVLAMQHLIELYEEHLAMLADDDDAEALLLL